MARRKDHSHDQLRQLALDVVLQHLKTQPAHSLSLRKVAQAVGYSPGTLLNIFGSYANLLLQVNACTLDQLAQRLNPGTEPTPGCGKKQLQTFARHYLAYCHEHPYQWQLLFEHQLPDDTPLPDWQQQRIERLFASLEQALQSLAPQAGHDALHRASRTIWASVHGIATLSLDNKLFTHASVDSRGMADSLIEHYVSAWCLQQQATDAHLSQGVTP